MEKQGEMRWTCAAILCFGLAVAMAISSVSVPVAYYHVHEGDEWKGNDE